MVTSVQVGAAVSAIKCYADLIRSLGSVPSGELYAQTMCAGVTLETHNRMVDMLCRTGLVKQSGHLLTWVGV